MYIVNTQSQMLSRIQMSALCLLLLVAAYGSSAYDLVIEPQAPPSTIDIVQSVAYVKDATFQLELKCKADHSMFTPKWEKEGTIGPVPGTSDGKDGIYPYSTLRVIQSGNYTCTAGDGDEKLEQSFKVFQANSALVTITPDTPLEPNYNSSDDSFTIECTIDASKESDVVQKLWYHYADAVHAALDDKVVINETSPGKTSLTFLQIARKQSGPYMCVFVLKGAGDALLYERAITDVYSEPFLRDRLTRSYSIMQGGTAEIKCPLWGHPLPKISWQRDDKPLTNESGREFLSTNEGLPKGTLSIRQLEFEDRAVYKCVAENGVAGGEAEKGFLLRVKDKLAALWPFLAIVAEVIILVTIIFLYERRQKQKHLDDDDEDSDADDDQ